MEGLAGIFKDLYTNFLLRDFAGKIVPGSFLFFSMSAMFVSPTELAKLISGRLSLLFIALCGGLAWTVILGLQSLAEHLNIWRYFPSAGGEEMDIQASIIEPFLRIACPDERLQYERYVVIKEATGNLFNVGLMAFPAWCIWLSGVWNDPATRTMLWGQARTKARTAVVLLYAYVIMVGLHLMNVEHVNKQFGLAQKTLEFIKKESGAHSCGPAAPPSSGKHD